MRWFQQRCSRAVGKTATSAAQIPRWPCSNALSSTAQEDNDGPSNIPLGEIDVGLRNRSLEAGIAQRVRDRAAILADFPSEPTAGAGGDRPAAGRDLLNPHRRVQRPERPSALQFSQSGCGFTVLLYVAGFSDSTPRDSSPSLFERVLVVEVL